MAAVVNYFRGEEFKMDAGSLAFSLTLYFIFAVTAIILILVRRIKAIGKLTLLSVPHLHYLHSSQ